jgi:hypothetical protein
MLATFRKTGASQFVEPDAVRAVHEFQHLVQFRMPMAYLEVAEALTKGTVSLICFWLCLFGDDDGV